MEVRWVFFRLSILFLVFGTRVLADEGYIFIVNSENPVNQVHTQDVADYYLKKKRQWPDGTSIRFIDQSDGSSARAVFLKRVLKKSVREVELYWIGQKLYSGEGSPIQVTSDYLVISLVARFKGAIGYVSSSFEFGEDTVGIKKIDSSGAF